MSSGQGYKTVYTVYTCMYCFSVFSYERPTYINFLWFDLLFFCLTMVESMLQIYAFTACMHE